jgi:outer membrane lipoprotein SlyB
MVGGGAVIGTIIGALVGHGKGAAIGAAVGAAGGAGAQVLTKGKEVMIPAETILKFNLDQDVTLAPER